MLLILLQSSPENGDRFCQLAPLALNDYDDDGHGWALIKNNFLCSCALQHTCEPEMTDACLRKCLKPSKKDLYLDDSPWTSTVFLKISSSYVIWGQVLDNVLFITVMEHISGQTWMLFQIFKSNFSNKGNQKNIATSDPFMPNKSKQLNSPQELQAAVTGFLASQSW